MKKRMILILLAIILVGSLGFTSQAFAHPAAGIDATTSQGSGSYCDEGYLNGAAIQALAEAFGITSAELKSDLANGETLQSVAKSLGFSKHQIADITQSICGTSGTNTVEVKQHATRWILTQSGNWVSQGYNFNIDTTNYTNKNGTHAVWTSLNDYFNYAYSNPKNYGFILWKGQNVYY
jgi:hypothetical protein